MLKEIIGKNIRYYREEQELTQKMVAHRAGFTAAYLGYLERGEKNPSVEIIERVADSLGIEPYYLLMDNLEENLPSELMHLLHVVNNLEENHTEFILTVIRAYLKTHHKHAL